MIGDLNKFVLPLKSYDIALMQHPHRSNLVDEVEAIIKRRKDNEDIVRRQLFMYLLDDYHCNELSATGILFRRNNELTRRHAESWWKEVLTKSYRDQLSFDYCCMQSGIVPYRFPYEVITSETFNYSGHK